MTPAPRRGWINHRRRGPYARPACPISRRHRQRGGDTGIRTEDSPLRRREITGSIALGGLVLLVALLALRFDLASLLFSNTAPTATIQRATAPNTDSTAAVAATMAPERRPAGDRSAKAETGDRLAKAPADSPAAKAPSSSFDVVRIDPEGSSVFAG